MSKEGATGKGSTSSPDSWELTSENKQQMADDLQKKGLTAMKKYEKEMSLKLDELKITSKDLKIQSKIPAGEKMPGEQEIKLTTNVFGMLLKKNAPIWRYQVAIYGIPLQEGKKLIVFRRPKDDAPKVLYRDDCRDIFLNVTKNPENHAFFNMPEDGDKNPHRYLVFDCTTFVYSLNKLDFTKVKNEDGSATLTFNKRTGNFDRFKDRFSSILFVFSRDNQEQMNIMDFEQATVREDAMSDLSCRLFLEVATSQAAFYDKENHVLLDSNTSYFIKPGNFGYKAEDNVVISKDKYLSFGTQKVMRMIEGPQQKPTGSMGLIVSSKKTPFYTEIDLLTFAQENLPQIDLNATMAQRQLDERSIAILEKALKDLYVYSKFSKCEDDFHKVGKVKNMSAAESAFIVNNKTIGLAEYYAEKFKYKLRYPFAPIVECSVERGQPPVNSSRSMLKYPLEVLMVCDNQRVRQQTPDLIQKMIRKCAVMPVTNYEHAMCSRNAWGFDNSEFCNEALISVTKKPMAFSGRVLNPPQLAYRAEIVRADDKCKWKSTFSKYLVPAKIRVWGIYFISSRPNNSLQNTLMQFANKFMNQCTSKGMEVAEYVDIGILAVSEEAIERKFKEAESGGAEFMLFVHHDDRERETHGFYKLMERRYDIVTQAISMRAFTDVNSGKRLTLENFVNKTNIKMGGLNYSLCLAQLGSAYKGLLSSKTLYIGFGVSKPAGGLSAGAKGADVLGFSANFNEQPFEFVGDFQFVPAGSESQEKLEAFASIIKTCVDRYRMTHQVNPRDVIIYRQGCDDGMFKTVLKFEVPYIQKKLDEVADGSNITWTLIVPSKMHNARIYKNEVAAPLIQFAGLRPMDQNIAPGTLADKFLVHPHFSEFYLCGHVALQGTAKVPRYTVIHSTGNHTLDDLERITWGLSFGHQIVNMTVSLPAPSYIANRYAERGRMLYNQVGAPSTDDYSTITNDLCHSNTITLRKRRVNA